MPTCNHDWGLIKQPIRDPDTYYKCALCGTLKEVDDFWLREPPRNDDAWCWTFYIGESVLRYPKPIPNQVSEVMRQTNSDKFLWWGGPEDGLLPPPAPTLLLYKTPSE